jgi:mitochondrial cardiolipin hydrolase
MTRDELVTALARTADDDHLSRGERSALSAQLRDAKLSNSDLAFLRNQAFDIAREKLPTSTHEVLEWLQDIVKQVTPKAKKPAKSASGDIHEIYFSPGNDCLYAIKDALRDVRKTLDICVFTITDNRIVDDIMDAHTRGVRVRVLTDNDKLHDAGSDIARIARAGIPVRTDDTEDHMHHKFAIFDQSLVIGGSYNWTRGAASGNHENIVIDSSAPVVAAFCAEFASLWEKLPVFRR